jgi:hypothetical protein
MVVRKNKLACLSMTSIFSIAMSGYGLNLTLLLD